MNGINIPLFALRNDEGSGIGEYLDLLPVIDWVKDVGMNMIQILPINDQGDDPSPYNSLSAFALNPNYLKLEGTPTQAAPSQRIDYADVRRRKEHIPRIKKTAAFHDYVSKFPWTFTYAKFKALKKKNNFSHFRMWENFDVTEDEISIYLEQQYLCYQQMKQVRDYADEKGVKLMGDVPILVSPDSADVWAHPEWFNSDLSAGAPPDTFNENGQKWGFPLYRWDEMEETHFRWWKERLRYANEFFHYYRIDHIIGFYRIWACSHDQEATDGFFVPADQSLWIPQGEKILKMMTEAVPMRPIGEDLGIVPDGVRENMAHLGIPGTKVVRWERDWHHGGIFIPYEDYAKSSMTTVSTHDSETLSEWWRDYPAESKDFANFMNVEHTPDLTEKVLKKILKDSHQTNSHFHINLLQEYFRMIPELRYENIEDDRINLPGIISPLNWSYLYKTPISEWTKNKKLKDEIHNCLS